MDTLVTALFGIFHIILFFEQRDVLLLFYIICHTVNIITKKTDDADPGNIV